MLYKNVIIHSDKKVVYHFISIDSSNKVKVLQTDVYDENAKVTVNQKNKKYKTLLYIPHTYLLERQVTLPKLSEDSLYNAAKYSLEEHYPGENIKNYTAGFLVTDSANKEISLVVWGIKKNMLQSLLNKYSEFEIEYVLPVFLLPLIYFEKVKVKNCLVISFLYPNEIVFLNYNAALKKMVVRNLPQSFYSYEELKNLPDETLLKSIVNFLKINNIGSDKNIYLLPYIESLASKLQTKGYKVEKQDKENSVTSYFNSLPFITDKQSLLKEEFKKVEPYVKILYHLLFLMVILLLTLAPLYYVKSYDYNKNKKDVVLLLNEFKTMYKEVTNGEWENFNKAYYEVSKKISETEDMLGVSKNFPIQNSSIQILQKFFSLAQVKEITVLRFVINIIQRSFVIRATTFKREVIESIIESLKTDNFDAKLNGSVISKEDGSFEFEIVIKW